MSNRKHLASWGPRARKSMNEGRKFQVGRMVLLSHGAYSSYSRTMWAMVVQEFDPAAELAAYLDANPEQKARYKFNADKFLASVIAKGYLVEIEEFFDEWLLGDYSAADEVEVLWRLANHVSDSTVRGDQT